MVGKVAIDRSQSRSSAHWRVTMASPLTSPSSWPRNKALRRNRAALQAALVFPGLSTFCQLTAKNQDSFAELQGGAIVIAYHPHAHDGMDMWEELTTR